MKKHNFSAGPCILPPSVIQKASEAILNFNDSGLSILEISHRSAEFIEIMTRAQFLALEHLNLQNKGYKVLFLHGGASLQFLMTAYNLLENKAAFLHTGTWSSKAIKEAKLFGQVIEVASSEERGFSYVPKDYDIPTDADYFHCTSNNTIYGTQLNSFPKTDVPVVCDMSSDIFSRVIDYSQFSLIYAGAQKNIGPAGVALVIIKEDILGKVSRDIPSMLDYQVHISKNSIYNTAPVFPIYVSMLNLQWLKEQGGVSAIEKINREKANLLYSEIDRNTLFKGYVKNSEDRSVMNATFNLNDSSLKENFDTALKEAGIHAINGHRSIGGYRASMYNALPIDSVRVLVSVMQELERKA